MSLKAEREKHEKGMEELRDANAKRGIVVHDRSEVHEDVVVDDGTDKGGEPKSKKVGEVHAFGGRAFVEVSGVFSQDDLFTLIGQLQKSFQAVQR